jgi:hypothetical protein
LLLKFPKLVVVPPPQTAGLSADRPEILTQLRREGAPLNLSIRVDVGMEINFKSLIPLGLPSKGEVFLLRRRIEEDDNQNYFVKARNSRAPTQLSTALTKY